MENPIEKPRAIKLVYQVKDDYRTPRYLVDCLGPFIDQFKKDCCKDTLTVFCPFDTNESEFVRYLSSRGDCTVINGDIKTGRDFFENPIPYCDVVISNPPFSKKKQIFDRLYKARIPFALLMNFQSAHYQEIGSLFFEIEKNTGIPVNFIIPDKKVSFDGNTSAFNTCYFCWRFTDNTHWIHLPHNNTKSNFVPAYSLTHEEEVV